MRAAILLTRGIFADRQSDELDRAVAVVRGSGTYSTVVGAYVDHGTPNLQEALDSCAAAGATTILIAPIYAPIDRLLSTWIPQILRRWLRLRPQFKGVEVILASSISASDALGRAALENLALAEQTGGSDEIREDLGVDYGNPGFNAIPAYSYQALVCVGPRCATRGSSDIYELVRESVARHGKGRDANGERPKDRVSVIRTGCLFPCNLGPMMVVHPGDTWYCSVTPEMVDEIVSQHFVNGQVVTQYTRTPGPERHDRPVPASPEDIVEDQRPSTCAARAQGVRPENAVRPRLEGAPATRTAALPALHVVR